ncbi:MAG: glutathione S-transferase family protein [Candidatus Binatia bacterium]
MVSEPLLYDLTDSPFCAKARICLNLKGVEWRRVTLTLGRLRELRRFNPLGKVPVLVDGTIVVPDSSAIARHLEDIYPTPALLPADPAARAYCTLLEDWADESLSFIIGAFKWLNRDNRARAIAATVDEMTSGPLRPLVGWAMAWHIRRRYAAWGFRESALPGLVGRMRENLGVVETLLSGREFLLGRTPLLCDVALFAQLSWMHGYAEGRLLDEVPNVLDWLGRMSEMPPVAAALAA